MQGMSERQYAAHVGLSRGAIQKAKTAERLVLYSDGSINAAASDLRRAETTDPSKTRKPPEPKLKPVPEAAVAAVGDTLSKAPGEVWSGVNTATGTATFYRHVAAGDDGTLSTSAPRLQGEVGTAGKELNLSSINLTSGATQTIDYYSVTQPTL